MGGNKIALITGGAKGIGRETARQLGVLGYSVWLADRDVDRAKQSVTELRVEGIDAYSVQLDITDETSVDAAVKAIEAVLPHLDVLVNNAGIGIDYVSQPSEEQIDVIRLPFEVNFFGTVRVTQALLPLLRKAPAARIVMVSSGLGSLALTSAMGSPSWNVRALGYSASKAALNMFVVKLAKELLSEGIKVNAVCPGSVATDFGGPNAPRTIEEGAKSSVRLSTLDVAGWTGGFYHATHDGAGPDIAPYPW